MSKTITWSESEPRVAIKPIRNPKKLTGTRFGAVLGVNAWSTPFQAWCAITRTYEPPFEDNKYTKAGKVIEPKVIDYLKRFYFESDNIVVPTDEFGPDPFKKTYGNFFDDDVFGGMWDALIRENGITTGVIEVKTTSRPQDFEEDVPLHYLYQAYLYAWLLGVDDVYVPVAFLKDEDYEHPENFKPSADNIRLFQYSMEEDCPEFENLVEKAQQWWSDHVETGYSPYYDEKKDKEYLDALRTHRVNDNADLDDLVAQWTALNDTIESVESQIAEEKKMLSDLEKEIKSQMVNLMGENDDKVVTRGLTKEFTLIRSERTTVDSDALKRDGLFNKYTKSITSYTLRKANI